MSKTILAAGTPADDVKVGVGGLLIRLARLGHRVVLVTVVGDLPSWLPTRESAADYTRPAKSRGEFG